jgi:hypothetical protein
MATEDKRQQFEKIVEGLTTDYPSLVRRSRRSWPRPVLVTVAVIAGLVWAGLSVAMVAWGTPGVVLTCVVVLVAAAAVAADARRRR